MKIECYDATAVKPNKLTVVLTDGKPKSEGIQLHDMRNPDNNRVNALKSKLGGVIDYKNCKSDTERLGWEDYTLGLERTFSILKKKGKSDGAINGFYARALSWLENELKCLQLKPRVVYYYGDVNESLLRVFDLVAENGTAVVVFTKSTDCKLLEELGADYTDKIKVTPATVTKPAPNILTGTNVWMNGDSVEEIFTPYSERMSGNCTKAALIRINGAESREEYQNWLLHLYRETNGKCKILEEFSKPLPNAIADMRGKSCTELLSDLNLDPPIRHLLENEIIRLCHGSEKELLYTVHALRQVIVRGMGRIYIFFVQHQPLTELQARVLYLLSCATLNVVIFNPEKIEGGASIESVYEINYEYCTTLSVFPTSSQDLVIETTAYLAEQEIREQLYDGSLGIYRLGQFNYAEVVRLKPMYEEIEILWDKEVSLRQGFNTKGDTVQIPAIFAKINGTGDKVKFAELLYKLLEDRDKVYCNKGERIDSLRGEDTWIFHTSAGEVFNSAKCFRGGVLQTDAFKESRAFPYGYLSESTQSHLLDGLKRLFSSDAIKDIFHKDKMDVVLEVFRMLPYSILTKIQNFDFTGISPKMVYIWNYDGMIPERDGILIHYLSELGFDVLMITPNGHDVFDRLIDKKIFTEYNLGQYCDDFSINYNKKKLSFFSKMALRR